MWSAAFVLKLLLFARQANVVELDSIFAASELACVNNIEADEINLRNVKFFCGCTVFLCHAQGEYDVIPTLFELLSCQTVAYNVFPSEQQFLVVARAARGDLQRGRGRREYIARQQ